MTLPAVTLYDAALGGAPVHVSLRDGRRANLPVHQWRAIRPGDESLLRRCAGPTLDVGCGPGRLAVELCARGVPTLGIDVSLAAVALTVRSGAPALIRDVFAAVPAARRWHRVLLADGNIGIGGDPAALLRRMAELIHPEGLVLVEVATPGSGTTRQLLHLVAAGTRSAEFPWARVDAGDLPDLAAGSGLTQVESWADAGRWFAALTSMGAGR
jgi:SAM-dependent methyltransferase